MQITVCGTCRKIKPETKQVVTELPQSNEFEVPVSEGSVILTCEPCYVPTLNMTISIWEAAGQSRPDLVELREAYQEEKRRQAEEEEEGEKEDGEGGEGGDDSPAGGEGTGAGDPAKEDPAHRRSLEEVKRELSEVAPPGGKKPTVEHKFTWNDWTELGKAEVLKWAKLSGRMGERGIPKAVVQAEYAQQFHDDPSFPAYLTREAYKAFKATL